MNTTTTAWNKAKPGHKCNTFPTVWGAIVGCTGKATGWRYTVGHFGRRDVEWACPTCQAARAVSEALIGTAHQEHLLALQAAAGVRDYRTARAKTIDGRPQLLRDESGAVLESRRGY